MKKFIVFGLTGFAILGLTFLTLGSRVPKYESGARLREQGEYAPSPAAPPMMDMPAPEPIEAEERSKGDEGKMGKKEKKAAPSLKDAFAGNNGLAAFGSGMGGGGIGDAMGLGSLGTKGRGMVALAKTESDGEATGGAEPAPTRAWFPETFLFEPLIVTDADGRANVPVKVPDRLTTWRVLALAHSRQGSQAGTVTSFLGTLPTYVDPVTPPFLFAGDVVKLPVQVVNTTDADVNAALSYSASGGTISSTGKTVKVPAGGSTMDTVTLTTTVPGAAVFKAVLGSTDAVEKSIELKPAGRREVQNKGGTLAAPRTFPLDGVATPLPGTESVRVQVYPGALGLVRNELSAAPGRGGVAEDAYLLQLLGQAPTLLRSLGAQPDERIIRDLSVLATQRVMQYARTPSLDTSTLLTEAALAHPQNPVLQRLGERLAMQIAAGQRADGTCQGETGWTLQRLLVSTSECVRAARASTETPAAKQRATAVTLKASGAFERNAARVNDAYTAAAILSSGAITGGAGDTFRKLILEKITDTGDGAKYLPVDSGVVRADGQTPSTYEATALAILALDGVPNAPLADLGTYLLSGYSSWSGWGDGRANLVALRAAVKLFKDPVPAGVKVTLSRDGKELASGTLDANTLKDVLVLEADATGSNGTHQWELKSEPAVPGLGFALQLVAYTPWKDEPGGGISLVVALPKTMKAGQSAELSLTAAGPGGIPLELELALPAGVQHDTTSLTKLVSAGAITRYETEDGKITLHLPPQNNGATWNQKLEVTPTLGGTLHSGSSSLAPENNASRKKSFAPMTWKID
ncbi:MAG: alpha-2-macroglobulin family protein [Archangium sp.]